MMRREGDEEGGRAGGREQGDDNEECRLRESPVWLE